MSETDLERLELYLDRELSDAETRELDARLATEANLATELERLRGQRSTRLSAMSMAFDTDAATVERLVASVRMAQASEALQRRRSLIPTWLPMRTVTAAAACLAVGLLLGITLQRQHGAGAGGMVPTPVVSTGNVGIDVSVPLRNPVGGLFVVTGRDPATGRELRIYFTSEQEARQFIERYNASKEASRPLNLGDARMLDEPL